VSDDLRALIARAMCKRHGGAMTVCPIGWDAADAALTVLTTLSLDEIAAHLDQVGGKELVSCGDAG
jgi:hypothetical protein